MKILNIGSINIDHVYQVDHFIRPGETLSSVDYHVFAGGKGFNQSVALARAGARVLHAGKVGQDAGWLTRNLQREGVDTSLILEGKHTTGHAIIQVVPSGENAIVLYGGANQDLGTQDVDQALSAFRKRDYLLIQNETSSVAHAIAAGHAKGLRVVFNPAPMGPGVHRYPLNLVDLFVLNETEGQALTGCSNPEMICAAMQKLFPRAATVLTLGAKGAIYSDGQVEHHQEAVQVKPVDTTAAGDTFIGFFLAALMQTDDAIQSLESGCRAAALSVMKPGALDSIPKREELDAFYQGPNE